MRISDWSSDVCSSDLFVIDRPRYALAVEQAEARIASAKATLGQARREATRDVALGDLVAKEAHEQNVARVATAQAALAEAMSARDAAALNLKRTQEVASVNGVVTNLDLHPGDFVAAGQQAKIGRAWGRERGGQYV